MNTTTPEEVKAKIKELGVNQATAARQYIGIGYSTLKLFLMGGKVEQATMDKLVAFVSR